MVFDPKKYGATPVSSSFNPTALGATPVGPSQPLSHSIYSAMAEAGKQGIGEIKQGLDTTLHPKSATDLITGPTKAAAGVIDTASAPFAPLFSPVGKIIGYIADKVSDTPLFKDAYAPVPVVQPGGGKVYQPTPNQEPIAAEKLADFTVDATKVASTALGVRPTINAASNTLSRITADAESELGGITSTGQQGISEAASSGKVPAQLMQRVARISKGKQVAFEDKAGQSVGQYLVDRGIFGTPDKIIDQLYNRYQTSLGAVDETLAKLPGTYKSPALGSMLKELETRERSVSSVGAPSRDMETVAALRKKLLGKGLDMGEVNQVKRLYERNVKLEYIKENAPDKVARATNLDSAVRGWQFNLASKLGFKNLPELNKETQLARQLTDDLGAEYSGQAGNNAISLTDWITLSGGTAANAAMFLTKKALTSKTVMSKVAETMAGSTPKVGTPAAEVGPATIDNYLEFLKRTSPKVEGRVQRPSDQASAPASTQSTKTSSIPNSTIVNADATANEPLSQALWRTTASKPSKAVDTSTGNAPTGKEGVSAQRADTSGPFEGNKPDGAGIAPASSRIRLGELDSQADAIKAPRSPRVENSASQQYHNTESTLDRYQQEGLPLRVYRGTLSGEIGSIPKEGVSVSFDNSVATRYAKARGQGGFVDKVEISPDAKVIKLNQVPNEIRAAEEGSDFAGKAAIWARKNGYDILDMSAGNEAELRILTSKALKGSSPSIPKEGASGQERKKQK